MGVSDTRSRFTFPAAGEVTERFGAGAGCLSHRGAPGSDVGERGSWKSLRGSRAQEGFLELEWVERLLVESLSAQITELVEEILEAVAENEYVTTAGALSERGFAALLPRHFVSRSILTHRIHTQYIGTDLRKRKDQDGPVACQKGR
ncbi:MAG: hypothetical protein ACRDJV_13495 [Actinomycetota bacterium]